MQKYKVLSKIRKTKHCTYYSAEDILTKQIVTIKKIANQSNWDQFLNRKQFTIMKQPKYSCFGKIKEVIKQNNKFFTIYYDELGINLLDLRNAKLSLEEIINISKQLLQCLKALYKQKIECEELRPEFFFLYKKKYIKLYHLEHRQVQDSVSTNLVDYKYIAPEIVLSSRVQENSRIFSMGCIISQLFLGKTLIYAKTKLDYMYILCNLFPKDDFEHNNSKPIMKVSQENTFNALIKSHCQNNELIDLLCEMLRINFNERISIQKCVLKLEKISNKTNNQKIKMPSILINRNKKEQLNESKQNNQLIEENQIKSNKQEIEESETSKNKQLKEEEEERNVKIIKQLSIESQIKRNKSQKEEKNGKKNKQEREKIQINRNKQQKQESKIKKNKLQKKEQNQIQQTEGSQQKQSIQKKKPTKQEFQLQKKKSISKKDQKDEIQKKKLKNKFQKDEIQKKQSTKQKNQQSKQQQNQLIKQKKQSSNQNLSTIKQKSKIKINEPPNLLELSKQTKQIKQKKLQKQSQKLSPQLMRQKQSREIIKQYKYKKIIKKKLSKEEIEKIFSNVDFQTQFTTTIAQLPILPRISKPLRYQKNFNDNVQPATVIKKSLKILDTVQPRNSRKSFKLNSYYLTRKATFSPIKRVKTLQTQQRLQLSNPKLTNYAIHKGQSRGMEIESKSSFFSNDEQKKIQKNQQNKHSNNQQKKQQKQQQKNQQKQQQIPLQKHQEKQQQIPQQTKQHKQQQKQQQQQQQIKQPQKIISEIKQN